MRRASGEGYEVSVIISHYNSLDLLWSAIASICSKTVVPLEIVVIDDASGSQFELPSHCGNKIALRLIRETVNRGAAWCRNRGIEEARGDLIAFLDADDQWFPDKLERCIASFGPKPPESEAQVLFSNVVLVTENERTLGNLAPYVGQAMLDFILLQEGYIQTSSIMMWRHQYPLIRFDGSLRRHQDWDFAINADLAGCTFLYLHDPLVKYSLTASEDRISSQIACGPSLDFFNKYKRLMSREHVSYFVFNVLIYKKLSLALRINILSRMILRELEIPPKKWMSRVARLIIGKSGGDLIKKYGQKIQIPAP